jgi:hypothetical protein
VQPIIVVFQSDSSPPHCNKVYSPSGEMDIEVPAHGVLLLTVR